MYYHFMSLIELHIRDIHTAAKVVNGGEALRDLCRKEVEDFDSYLRRFGNEYSGGLSKFEKLAVEGYLYQKIRGRLDEKPEICAIPEGREDGAEGSD